MRNQIIEGDCTRILPTLPHQSADFVLTDPPYLVRYKDRSGRTVRNDDRANPESVLGAFSHLYAALKPDRFCVSFYGWNKVDAFFSAWHRAGFTVVGHIVWPKGYASGAGFMEYRHEQAYVLAKGRPKKPARPLPDVQAWAYSGNRFHPTEKAVSVLAPLIECFSAPGQLVLDPFAGSGSTLVAAALARRDYLGVELEAGYCEHARRRLAGVARYARRNRTEGERP